MSGRHDASLQSRRRFGGARNNLAAGFRRDSLLVHRSSLGSKSSRTRRGEDGYEVLRMVSRRADDLDRAFTQRELPTAAEDRCARSAFTTLSSAPPAAPDSATSPASGGNRGVEHLGRTRVAWSSASASPDGFPSSLAGPRVTPIEPVQVPVRKHPHQRLWREGFPPLRSTDHTET